MCLVCKLARCQADKRRLSDYLVKLVSVTSLTDSHFVPVAVLAARRPTEHNFPPSRQLRQVQDNSIGCGPAAISAEPADEFLQVPPGGLDTGNGSQRGGASFWLLAVAVV